MLVDGAHPANWRDPAAQDLADIGWRILRRPIIHERRLSTYMPQTGHSPLPAEDLRRGGLPTFAVEHISA
jgi:hypothetical protein